MTWDPHPELENTARTKQRVSLRPLRFGRRAGAGTQGSHAGGWCYHPQLPEMAAFAKAVPEVTIVLNHVGGLLREGPYANRNDEVMDTWRKGIAAVAACPNVVVKLGGLGMVRCGFDWHTREKPIGSEELAAAQAPFLSYCIEKFTPARSMLESNFPVDKVSFSYNVMWNAFKRFSKGYSATERAAMFHDTAARIYRIALNAGARAPAAVRETPRFRSSGNERGFIIWIERRILGRGGEPPACTRSRTNGQHTKDTALRRCLHAPRASSRGRRTRGRRKKPRSRPRVLPPQIAMHAHAACGDISRKSIPHRASG